VDVPLIGIGDDSDWDSTSVRYAPTHRKWCRCRSCLSDGSLVESAAASTPTTERLADLPTDSTIALHSGIGFITDSDIVLSDESRHCRSQFKYLEPLHHQNSYRIGYPFQSLPLKVNELIKSYREPAARMIDLTRKQTQITDSRRSSTDAGQSVNSSNLNEAVACRSRFDVLDDHDSESDEEAQKNSPAMEAKPDAELADRLVDLMGQLSTSSSKKKKKTRHKKEKVTAEVEHLQNEFGMPRKMAEDQIKCGMVIEDRVGDYLGRFGMDLNGRGKNFDQMKAKLKEFCWDEAKIREMMLDVQCQRSGISTSEGREKLKKLLKLQNWDLRKLKSSEGLHRTQTFMKKLSE